MNNISFEKFNRMHYLLGKNTKFYPFNRPVASLLKFKLSAPEILRMLEDEMKKGATLRQIRKTIPARKNELDKLNGKTDFK